LILKEVVDALAKENQKEEREYHALRRYPFHVSLSLVQLGSNGQFRGQSTALGLDISYTGMAILSRKPIPTDTLLQANLDHYLSRPWRLDMIVVDCMEVVDDMFRIGCVFILDEEIP